MKLFGPKGECRTALDKIKDLARAAYSFEATKRRFRAYPYGSGPSAFDGWIPTESGETCKGFFRGRRPPREAYAQRARSVNG